MPAEGTKKFASVRRHCSSSEDDLQPPPRRSEERPGGARRRQRDLHRRIAGSRLRRIESAPHRGGRGPLQPTEPRPGCLVRVFDWVMLEHGTEAPNLHNTAAPTCAPESAQISYADATLPPRELRFSEENEREPLDDRSRPGSPHLFPPCRNRILPSGAPLRVCSRESTPSMDPSRVMALIIRRRPAPYQVPTEADTAVRRTRVSTAEAVVTRAD
jgi:hypothetical protein